MLLENVAKIETSCKGCSNVYCEGNVITKYKIEGKDWYSDINNIWIASITIIAEVTTTTDWVHEVID